VRLERHESTVTLRERQQLEEISKTISCFRWFELMVVNCEDVTAIPNLFFQMFSFP
jgi:hypothetical protein